MPLRERFKEKLKGFRKSENKSPKSVSLLSAAQAASSVSVTPQSTIKSLEKGQDEAHGKGSVDSHDDYKTADTVAISLPIHESKPEVETPNAARESLWTRAVASVEAEPKFAELVKQHRETVAGSDECPDMQKRAKELLDKVPDSYLTIKFGNSDKRKFVVRDQVRKCVKGVLACKDVIKEAISAEPHAALIWASVLVVLPLLEKIFQQDDDAASGFEWLSSLLIRLHAMEETMLSLPVERTTIHENLVTEFEKNISEAYSIIYRYQILIVVHYVQTKARRTIDNLTSTGWKKMADDAETAVSRIDEIDNTLFKTRLVEATDKISNKIDTFSQILEDTRKHVLETRHTQLISSLPRAADAVFRSAANKQLQTCMEGTQQETLSRIQKWAADPDGKLVFWLHSLAGTGKSSISQTVATCLEDGFVIGGKEAMPGGTYLGGSFFLKREDDNRNTLLRLFTTIAVLLAQQNSALEGYIAAAIHEDDTIGTQVLSEQMDKLILKPLLEFEKELPVPVRLVVVIDALDKCIDLEDAQKMLQLLPKLSVLQRVQLRFFITSRPLVHIQEAMPSEDVIESIALGKIRQHEEGDFGLVDDITLLVSSRIEQITQKDKSKPPQDWITPQQVRDLVTKSDGLFIYAATICRFLDGVGTKTLPVRTRISRLKQVLDGKAHDRGPDDKLSEIYLGVLSFPFTSLHEDEKKDMYATIRRILGFVALVFRPVPITALANMLETDVESITSDLEELHSIISVPSDESSVLEFFHLSFREYLLDKERSAPDFWVDAADIHRALFDACFRIMETELHQDMCNVHLPGFFASDISPKTIKKRISPQLQYACLYWGRHLAELDVDQRKLAGFKDNGRAHEFLLSKFLFWLEALSLIGMASSSIQAIFNLKRLTNSKDDLEISHFLDDAGRFALSYGYIIQKAPLQTYISALASSPTQSIVRQTFQHLIPKWIVRMPEAEDQWSSELLAFEGHNLPVVSVAMSSDGATIASASLDGSVHLWDVETGVEKLRFTDMQSIFDLSTDKYIDSIAFSPDDKTVIYSFGDGTVRLRNIASGETTTLQLKPNEFYSEVYPRPYGYEVVGTLSPRDVMRQRDLEAVKLDDKRSCRVTLLSVSFGGYLLALGYKGGSESTAESRGGVFLWDTSSQKFVRDIKLPFMGSMIVLSLRGTWLGVACENHIEVVDVGTGKTRWRLEEYGGFISDFAISATEEPVLAVGSQGCIKIYVLRDDDSSTPSTPVTRLLANSEFDAVALCFPTDYYLVSGSISGHVHLWDMATGHDFPPIKSFIEMVKLSKDEQAFLITDGDHADLWDMRTGTSRPALPYKDAKYKASPGRHIITVTHGRKTEFWKGDLSKVIKELDNAIRFGSSEDGQMTAVLESSSTLRVFDTQIWAEKTVFEESDFSTPIKFSPDNRILAWRCVTGDYVSHFDEMDDLSNDRDEGDNDDSIYDDDVDDDGDQDGDDDDDDDSDDENNSKGTDHSSCYLVAKDLETGETILKVENAISFVFSRNGKLLAATIRTGERSKVKHIIDVKTGTTRYTLDGFKEITFDYQGKYISFISGLDDNLSLVIAQAETGKAIRTFPAESMYDRIIFSRAGHIVRIAKEPLPGYTGQTIYALNPETLEEIAKCGTNVQGFDKPVFSDDSTHLVYQCGKFYIPLEPTHCPSDGLPEKARDCLYVEEEWVMQGMHRLFWLPPRYRVKDHNRMVQDATVATILYSTDVAFLEFDLARTPKATGWEIDASEDEDIA